MAEAHSADLRDKKASRRLVERCATFVDVVSKSHHKACDFGSMPFSPPTGWSGEWLTRTPWRTPSFSTHVRPAEDLPAYKEEDYDWPVKMTFVMIFITASDMHVKKSNSSLPPSPIMARVMPRITKKNTSSRMFEPCAYSVEVFHVCRLLGYLSCPLESQAQSLGYVKTA